MRKAVLILSLLGGLTLAGCYGGIPGVLINGSGRTVTRPLGIDEFDVVEVDSAFNVRITRGDEFKVTINADENFIEHVRADKTGSTLHLYLDPKYPGSRGWKLGTLEARITMPDIRELRLNGASHGEIDGFTRDIQMRLSGASALKGTLAAGTLVLDGSGASTTNLEGSAQDLTVHGSGASRFELGDLRAGNARVELSGASAAAVSSMGQLDYTVSGGSQLSYGGHPRIGQAQTSGGASARQK